MTKPIKYTVAVILKDDQKPNRFLVVKRPDDDPDLQGHWGLPAVTLLPGELPEEAAQRVCREKLGCRAAPVRFLGAMFQQRNSYDIVLFDIEMVLAKGQRPDNRKADTQNTAYVAQKWTTNPLDLMTSAQNGSCCSSIFLTDQGLLDRGQWVASLQGSSTVG